MLKLMTVAAAILAAGTVAVIWNDEEDEAEYVTAAAEQGDLVASVTLSGRVVPVVEVEVGSQLSGLIDEILIDFNGVVEKGQPIARLDPQAFDARLRESEAELEMAEAGHRMRRAALLHADAAVAAARADLQIAEARRERALALSAEGERALERAGQLRKQGIVSADHLDRAATERDTSAADLRAGDAEIEKLRALLRGAEAEQEIARANISTAAAEVRKREAMRDQARVNVERTTIRAPISGVVISRDVDPGQTVAASLEAPKLFVLAQSLERMQVHARVDEADIGRVRVGQTATFTVDAYPDGIFRGEVVEIRKAPQVSQGVVSYPVIISLDNPEQLLFPGMTAIVEIEVLRTAEALKIPNAALRFTPHGVPGENPAPPEGEGAPGVVWIEAAGSLAPRAVRVGASDGYAAEITAGDLAPGDRVVIGVGAASGG